MVAQIGEVCGIGDYTEGAIASIAFNEWALGFLVTGGVGDYEASTLLQDHQLFCDMLQQQLSKAQVE